MSLPHSFRSFGVEQVEIIKFEGTDDEQRLTVEAHVQADSGFFAVDTPIEPGDIVIVPDPRFGTMRRVARKVDVNNPTGPGFRDMAHIQVHWGAAAAPRAAPVRRLSLENLHPEVVTAASDLFVDGHFSDAIFKACVALEVRVRVQSGLDLSGEKLMSAALGGESPRIDVATESGQSGQDEQAGIRFMLMGVMRAIRNPKGHGLVKQGDPQRALQYLAVVSILFYRLDDAR